MTDFRMVVLGDSVPWGQGLNPPDKFYSLVQVGITGSLDPKSCVLLAHSGATIGVGVTTTGPKIDGEVPTSYPTILQQVESFTDSPESVDLVLVNGGINDIDIRLILNPFTDSSDLHDMIRQFCFDMKALLKNVVDKFTKPTVKIVVTSYFPLLSRESFPKHAPAFLAMQGAGLPPFFDPLSQGIFLSKIIANCQQFYDESNQVFKQAVKKTNETAGGSPRVFFARPPFTASNAALAPEAWLWGLESDLSPQDPVSKARAAACDLFEKDPVRRISCHRASVGHPNITGSQKFAEAILAAIKS